MMPRTLQCVLVGLLLTSPAMVSAQGSPDFTGTWVMDMTRSESAAQRADASPRTPVQLVIAQEPGEVSIETQVDGRKELVNYSFDKAQTPRLIAPPAPEGTSGRTGTEGAVGTSGSLGTTLGPRAGAQESTVEQAMAEYKDGRLTTTTIYRVNGMAMKKVESRSLSANGREMIVETLVQVEHGYQSNHKDAQAYTVVKDVYTK
jgi:hypothetical protein